MATDYDSISERYKRSKQQPLASLYRSIHLNGLIGNPAGISPSPGVWRVTPPPDHQVLWRIALARNASPGQHQAEIGGYPGNPRL